MKLSLLLFLSPAFVSAGTPWGRRQNRSLFGTPKCVSCETSTSKVQVGAEAATDLTTATTPNTLVPRGGQSSTGALPFPQNGSVDMIVKLSFRIITTFCRVALPVFVTTVRAISAFYSKLPIDLIKAQAGLAYCFAGGYFPTLFAALQAAQQCGWTPMVRAINDLADEAIIAVKACAYTVGATGREIFLANTKVVMSTIDPIKINQAVAALYTTWMGVSSVLEREFARTIAMAMTVGSYIRPITDFVIAPAAYKCVPGHYHRWVPVVIGWGCKAGAMSIAWRVQRVLTAYSSAVAGGLMFGRSCFRMIRSAGNRAFGKEPPNRETSFLDEVFGYTVAALGLYSQLGDGFNFDIPFPFNLISWPFELAEKWIQWQITKDV